MTESEWLSSADPAAMLRHLDGKASARKLRLFACACCYHVWDLLTDERSRRAVSVASRYADGQASVREVDAANQDARRCWRAEDNAAGLAVYCGHGNPGFAAQRITRPGVAGMSPAAQAVLLREVFGNPFRPAWPPQYECPFCKDDPQFRASGTCRECRGKGVVLADWLTPTVLGIARRAYEEPWAGQRCWSCEGKGSHLGSGPDRGNPTCDTCYGAGKIGVGSLDPAALAVLADSLEEAGVEDGPLLRHLRTVQECPGCGRRWDCLPDDWRPGCPWCGQVLPRPAPHVRGCFAIDAILGKG